MPRFIRCPKGVLASVAFIILCLASAESARADSRVYQDVLHSTGLVEAPHPEGRITLGTCWLVDEKHRGPGRSFGSRRHPTTEPRRPDPGGCNMYHSLLVPLDRSSSAEQALPLALSIARRAHARLDLVEVHALYALEDPTAGWAPFFEPERDAEYRRQEQRYLDGTATWLTSVSPVSVSTGVLSGSTVLAETVADSILARARAGKADLIVMATHGRGPLSRLGIGSVADELIRRAGVPVLLVRPGEMAADLFPEPALDNILIPLDGSALAEQVLGPALDLARLTGARCSLLRIIAPRSSARNGALGGSPQEAEAEAYLERVAAWVREQGVQVRARVVVAPHVAEAILEEATAQASDLIALATHGRGGLTRLLRGIVADRLVRAAAAPLLIYCPSGKGRQANAGCNGTEKSGKHVPGRALPQDR